MSRSLWGWSSAWGLLLESLLLLTQRRDILLMRPADWEGAGSACEERASAQMDWILFDCEQGADIPRTHYSAQTCHSRSIYLGFALRPPSLAQASGSEFGAWMREALEYFVQACLLGRGASFQQAPSTTGKEPFR